MNSNSISARPLYTDYIEYFEVRRFPNEYRLYRIGHIRLRLGTYSIGLLQMPHMNSYCFS